MKPMLLALVFVPSIAQAEMACDVPIDWDKPRPARAAIVPSMRYALSQGQTADLALAPVARVRFAAKPGRKPSPGSFAGLAAVDVKRGGTIAIALSSRAYVDLVRGGKALGSVSHSDACGSLRKTVVFAVTPGRYIVQLADAPDRRVRMFISR